MLILASRPRYLMQTTIIKRSPEGGNKSLERKKPLSPEQLLSNRFLKANKDLAQPIEYKDLNGERIKIVKGADGTSIAIIKAVNPDKEIIEGGDNVKSESRLVKEKNGKYTLLSMERGSGTTPAGDIQFITETVNDIGNMAAEQMLSKIESRISDGNKINKELKEAKIQRMIDLAYQNDQRDADQMMYDIMDDESII